jgi:hypothetical protein
LYACRGGLTDGFLKNTLNLKPDDLHRDFSETFRELNKRVHVQADTVLTDPDEIEEFANNAIRFNASKNVERSNGEVCISSA